MGQDQTPEKASRRHGASGVLESLTPVLATKRQRGAGEEHAKESPPTEAAARMMLNLSQNGLSQPPVEEPRLSQLDSLLPASQTLGAPPDRILSSQTFRDIFSQPDAPARSSQEPSTRRRGESRPRHGSLNLITVPRLGQSQEAKAEGAVRGRGGGSMSSGGTAGGSGRKRDRSGKPTRRGPMDEMRQLVRILQKLFPASQRWMVDKDGGGGNRVSETQIKSYLMRLLGPDTPQPEWGVPGGWNEYVSRLLTWCSGTVITPEQTLEIASRQAGRSWELNAEALARLGIEPTKWELPLVRAPGMPVTLQGLDTPAKKPSRPCINRESLTIPELWEQMAADAKLALQVVKGQTTPGPMLLLRDWVKQASELLALVEPILASCAGASSGPGSGETSDMELGAVTSGRGEEDEVEEVDTEGGGEGAMRVTRRATRKKGKTKVGQASRETGSVLGILQAQPAPMLFQATEVQDRGAEAPGKRVGEGKGKGKGREKGKGKGMGKGEAATSAEGRQEGEKGGGGHGGAIDLVMKGGGGGAAAGSGKGPGIGGVGALDAVMRGSSQGSGPSLFSGQGLFSKGSLGVGAVMGARRTGIKDDGPSQAGSQRSSLGGVGSLGLGLSQGGGSQGLAGGGLGGLSQGPLWGAEMPGSPERSGKMRSGVALGKLASPSRAPFP